MSQVETFDALCLREPYLELVLLRLKTLETRRRVLRHAGGTVVFVSAVALDEDAWRDPAVGGLLPESSRARALRELGCTRGLVTLGDCRPGVPGADDEAARIKIALPDGGVRNVWPVLDAARLEPRPTTRLRPDGTVAPGAAQGFFKIPAGEVVLTGGA